jgi:nucleoside triphosphate pyrophosphatase
MKKIILASASPRRKALLELLCLPFEIHPGDINEKLDPGLTPRKQVEVLSRQKALSVAGKFHNSVIIAADTMVVFNNELIGKPKDETDAKRMLKMFSGKMHSVVTGFTILDTGAKKSITRSTETSVRFRKLTNNEISRYVQKEKPFDKAGGYAANELAAVFIKKIEGDFFGIVGLPIFLLAKELKEFGISVL